MIERKRRRESQVRRDEELQEIMKVLEEDEEKRVKEASETHDGSLRVRYNVT